MTGWGIRSGSRGCRSVGRGVNDGDPFTCVRRRTGSLSQDEGCLWPRFRPSLPRNLNESGKLVVVRRITLRQSSILDLELKHQLYWDSGTTVGPFTVEVN